FLSTSLVLILKGQAQTGNPWIFFLLIEEALNTLDCLSACFIHAQQTRDTVSTCWVENFAVEDR
ncbi:LOW QUALITY PROTEIN: hypothetical protein PanWU01x14_109130, partial [Parasponia andersonii]